MMVAAVWGVWALAMSVPASNADPIDSYISARSAEAPGCNIAAMRDGRIDYERSFGHADLEHGTAITSATKIEAGSVSKQFTAAAVLLLAEQGKIGLDDDIRKYVPELPDFGATITIDQLLSHTSGLRDWGEVADLGGWPRGTRVYELPDVIRITQRQRALNYAPGTAYSYTNTGYSLLAIIIARVSGMSLAEYTRQHLFAPVDMADTLWRDDFQRVVPGRAQAYDKAGEAYKQAMPFENVIGNGGLITTTRDLLKWSEALATGKLGQKLTERMREQAQLTDGTTISYARGVVIEPDGDSVLVSHSGSTGGYRAWLGQVDSKRVAVAVLCNASDVDPSLGRKLLARYAPAPALSTAGAWPSATARAGLYRTTTTGRLLRLVANDGGLAIADGPALVPLSADSAKAGGWTLNFASNRIARATDDSGQAIGVRKVAEYSPTPKELAALVGTYSSPEADTAYKVSLEDGTLTAQVVEHPSVEIRLTPSYRDGTTLAFNDGTLRFENSPGGGPRTMVMAGPRVWSMTFKRAK